MLHKWIYKFTGTLIEPVAIADDLKLSALELMICEVDFSSLSMGSKPYFLWELGNRVAHGHRCYLLILDYAAVTLFFGIV